MIELQLTDEERKVARDYARRLEKGAKRWRPSRWAAMAAFVFGLCLLLAVEHSVQKMHSVMNLPDEIVSADITPTAKLNASHIELLATHMDVKIVTLRAELYLVLKALIVAGIGVGLFVSVASNWRRDRRDRLMAKLLRCLADGHEQEGGQDRS
ncbi:MAG TPA: hypothetical protein VMZ31_00470 [Phycisphaerae bacterium]|nr:hypothetical protein [Phycisphaerae bacterium]